MLPMKYSSEMIDRKVTHDGWTVQVDQVLLPYMIVDGKQTVYQLMQEQRMMLPTGEK